MNIKKYEAFVRAVELGSLSKAAEELGYTQSGISHMMQSLEDEIGFPLMVRTSSGILPNAEGEQLMPIIRQLLNINECLEQNIAKIKGADTGRIRIASFSTVATYWLPPILRDFQKNFPNVEIQIVESGADRIETMMENHEADLCLYSGGASKNFEWMPLYVDQLMALLPPGHPLTELEAVPIEALESEQFIMPLAGYDYEVHHILDQLNHYPHIRFSSCADSTIISMVSEGLGISILPELLLRNYRTDAVAMPMNPAQHRILGMGVTQVRAASPVTRNFMHYVQNYVKVFSRNAIKPL
ncbi:MAG: LysR family transcriptional regulator [Oscillibacter sp.]|jgi:DNA-binding transcriptional LysR family regulator|nr:LysR family transcriptional regulator [Oscillibacter sp.]